MITLRPYQVEAVEAVEAAWRRGIKRPLLHLATGLGKTIVFAELIRRQEGRALVLGHREELLQQALEKLRLVAGARLDLGLVRAEDDDHARRVVVASVATLAQPRRLERLNRFDVIVVDECHHATAESYRRVLDHFDGALALGVTATPERGDRQDLAGVWDEIVYSKGLVEAVREQYLADLRAVRVRLAVDMDDIHVRGGDYVEAEAEAAYQRADAPRHAVTAYQQHAAGRKVVAFTSGVGLAHDFVDAFRAAGIAAAAIHGSTPRPERKATLAAFSRGDIKVLANCAVLTEGFDEATIDCILMARPTTSRPLYMQMLGRGTRRHPSKNDCLVIDLVGVSERHDLVTLGSVFGVPTRPDLTITAALRERDEQARRHADVAAVDGRLVSTTVDLFSSDLHWASGADGICILPAGGGHVVLRRETEGWAVWHLEREAEHRIAGGLTPEYAQGTAEDLARRLGNSGLAAREAGWRGRPATANQLAALRRFGLPTDRLTSGQASDALSTAIVRNALAPATPPQLRALRRQGIAPAPGLTKREASRLLSGQMAA